MQGENIRPSAVPAYHLYVNLYTSAGGASSKIFADRGLQSKTLGDAAGKKGGGWRGQQAAPWGGLSHTVWAAGPHVSRCPGLVQRSRVRRTQHRSGLAMCGADGPHPAPARSREGLRASGRHLAPITGPRRAPPVPGCGAAAEHGQCGMEMSRLRSHEKLPPPAFRQDRGRGNSHARRVSTRSCSRFNELCFNERDPG